MKSYKKYLFFLIKKYVPESQQKAFYDDISKSTVPVKGILADFNKIKTRTVDEVDGDLIRDIYFLFLLTDNYVGDLFFRSFFIFFWLGMAR
ncbi:hypothetical protein [Enterobacter cloacae complex sp. 315G5]|uniref:hypothetical protein n=1 Tax=Enterobacter cloacae complex sp. 315G5 TaxID=3395872 RepID=UPI003CF7A853